MEDSANRGWEAAPSNQEQQKIREIPTVVETKDPADVAKQKHAKFGNRKIPGRCYYSCRTKNKKLPRANIPVISS
ncbi:hypothetical protein OESDEN_07796 [Oesophagostomum dentatum]|uniref:Uncharacterized protein n=1 Tax=Oesophagostomum dentatum TaxID=61180 RepID=A0A0B1T4Z7_OESDE|nr:hypothetical protein OESDEN_07796 [Oesophagostomum dentatum]